MSNFLVKFFFLAEKTRMSPEVAELWSQFERTNSNITKMKESIEALLQPNPNLRMEKFVLSKIDSTNQLGRPDDSSAHENLGRTLTGASQSLATTNSKVQICRVEKSKILAKISISSKFFFGKFRYLIEIQGAYIRTVPLFGLFRMGNNFLVIFRSTKNIKVLNLRTGDKKYRRPYIRPLKINLKEIGNNFSVQQM